ncbi:MAG: BMP family ABC transporter substrate-binding protein [Gaiella sp.]|uniref:BMP family ABC transporter substrate-binding protein n=1 Tax=Gaiella sp. TaxID=2663207 RepID=UPI002C42BAD5|nr:BMP family ABC transporter substrate-binding protein [Gaiella sp.]
MAIRKWMVLASVALVAVSALTVASIGSAKPAAPAKLRVALVTDVGGLNDKSFNALAYKGLKDAQKKLGIDGRVFISKSSADYIPNLTTGARQYDLVVGVGFLMADQVAAVAKRFPDKKFAIVDFAAAGLKGKPKNARGILFAEQDAGCLAGVAAAWSSKSGVIGSVGGLKIPPVDHYIAGYQYCAKKYKPGTKTLNDYSQDFVDQAKCKEIALNQIQQDADVIFQVAGACGLGALQAAKDSKDWGIGVDADQFYLGKHVLTSALKRVDVGVFDTIKLAGSSKWKGGVDGIYSAKNGGVGVGKVSTTAPRRTALINVLGKWQKDLASGKVKPPSTVK